MSKWPKKVKHRGKVLAKVYRPCSGRSGYRVSWHAEGRRLMKSFPCYAGKGGAKEYAEALVKELAKNSKAVMLTPGQATDALAALECLDAFFVATGKQVSLLHVAGAYCDAAKRLGDHDLREAVSGFLSTVASVKRVDIAKAVEEFITAEEPRTKSTGEERPELSPKYAYNRAIQLRRFAAMFPNTAVVDLAKAHVDLFFSSKPVSEFSGKSRNHHRAALRQFIAWCVRKDYLSVAHRLNEADGLKPQRANTSAVHCYTPKEFRTLLEAADTTLRPLLAIGGLAGLRTQELLRLSWEDVWNIKGHIEVTAGKAKTRQRRLVEVCAALKQWLHPYRNATGPLWAGHEVTFQQHVQHLCERLEIPRRLNGLRHTYCSCAYVLRGENWTAQQAGNSPAMIHASYKGLVTKAEARRWFAVKPTKSAKNIIPLKAAL